MPSSRRTSFPILGLLAQGPMSGYDLRQAIQTTFGHFWAESFGQIYPELRRLTQAGLIRPSAPSISEGEGGGTEGSASTGRRRVHELTDAGRAALDDWLLVPARSQVLRNELLLKLYFAGQRAPSSGLEQITRQRTDLRRRLALLARVELRLRDVLDDSPGLVGWLAGVRHGVLMAEAGLRWCDEAEELLAASISRSGT